MKKIFQLIEKNKKPERTLDSIKNEIRKYFKRERKKELPEDAIYWEFECKFGKTQEDAELIGSTDIIKALDITLLEKWKNCYIEIISKPSEKKKAKKAVAKTDEEEA